MRRSLLIAVWLIGVGFAVLAVLLAGSGRVVDALSVGAGVAVFAVATRRAER